MHHFHPGHASGVGFAVILFVVVLFILAGRRS